MDLRTITDVKELKALAYDQLVIKQNAENNLSVINQRILEVENQNTVEELSSNDAPTE